MRRRALLPVLVVAAALTGVAVLVSGLGSSDVATDGRSARPLAAACPDNQVSPNRYADVATGSPFDLPISCLTDHGVVQGTTATTYAPGAPVSRQQMAQLVHRLGELAGVEWEDASPEFRDVAGLPAAAQDAVGALTEAGIVRGQTDSLFAPEAAVTRGQLASFLARFAETAGLEGVEPGPDAFDDDEELASEPDIDAMAAAGVTVGSGHGRFFDPFRPVTRDQMAAFLARVLDLLVEQGRADGAYRDDVAPVSVALDQDGQLVEPGSPLTGRITGDGVASARVASPCVTDAPAEDADASAPGLQLVVPTDRHAPIGRCPVTVSVAFASGRTREEALSVVQPGFTTLPELVHVERAGTSAREEQGTSAVRFLFDAPAELGGAAAGLFTLTAYSVQGGHIATSVRQDGPQAAIATFGTRERPVGEAELLQVSYATAFAGAMTDAEGRQTPTGTAQLNPRWVTAQAYAGPTWSADLLSVTAVRPDLRRPQAFLADLLFDSPLEAGEPPNAREYAFDLVLTDATGRRCSTADPLPARRLTVSCERVGPEGLPEATAVSRAVVSTPGYGSDDPLAASLLTRRPTVAPDLVTVAWGPAPDQVTYTFDEPVEVGGADRFLAVGPYPPSSGSGVRAELSTDDPRSVVVTMQGTELERATIATARGRAVVSRSTGRENVFEQVWVPARAPEVLMAGRTLMPDLVAVRVGADGVARYAYDAPLPPVDPALRPVEDLRLYLPDGTELVCTGAAVEQGATQDATGGGTVLACRDFRLGRDGPAATAEQVGSATYATASYGTPPAARVVEGARRPPA